MVDFDKSDKIIKKGGKVDQLNTDNRLNSLLFIRNRIIYIIIIIIIIMSCR